MNIYNVVLVDDEDDVRMSIEQKVDWNALGYRMVGSVSNGEEALELTEQLHVDVVMTDIKMPFMDGLTLCRKLKENYKNIKVVLYSGFDEFELAREAVHLEAEEYLLKPIAAKDIEAVFKKIKDNLDREFDERTNIQKLNDYYQQSLPMMREQLLAGILTGKLSAAQISSQLEFYGMDFESPYYCVGVLGGGAKIREGEFQTRQMLMLSLSNLTREYFEKNMPCHVLLYLEQVVVIARLPDAKDVNNFIYHMNQVCKMGSRMLNLDIDAGVGKAYETVSKIVASYEDARTAFDYCVLSDESQQTIYINDVEPDNVEYSYRDLETIPQIIYEIKFGTEESIGNAIDNFLKDLTGEGRVSIQQYQLSLMEIVTEMMKLLRNNQLEVSEVFDAEASVYDEIGKFHSMSEMSNWLKACSLKMWGMIRNKRSTSTNMITDKAKQYVEENYADSDLSVEQICNYLNVSATYFSVMFKKRMGMSFVSYLTKVRLEHAVELLNSTDDKSYIIAEKVGYPEPNYFSYVFKKEYGVSPSKYRTNKEA